MSDDTTDWRWVDIDGVQKDIDEWDLVSSLSEGTLEPRTLVWKRGWQEWLPASRVAELASAMPEGQVEAAVEPKLGDDAEPPAPPARPAEPAVGASPVEPTAPARAAIAPAHALPPPPLGGRHDTRGAMAAASLIGKAAAPPPPARPPMPTLVEPPTTPTTSATLRPPGAVPPPPRRMPANPAPMIGPSAARVPALETPLPQIAIREKTPDETAAPPPVAITASPAEPAQAAQALPPEPATLPLASPAPVTADAEPLPSWDVETETAAPAPPAPHRIGALATPTPTQPSTTLIVLGALVGALAALVIVLLIARGSHDATPLAAGPANVGTAGEAKAQHRGPCTLAHTAKRLATDILPGVPPYLASAPDGQHVVIGYAATRTEAVGLMVNPETLDAARAFDQKGSGSVVGTVPTVASGRVEFAVDRDGGPLANSRSVDARPGFVLGMTDTGLARAAAGKTPAVIWPGGTSERMTEIRVATTPHGDHAVTFRRGGQSGKVLVGWLGADGSKKSELERVEAPSFVGTPMVAANDDSILVVFAARARNTDHWSVELAASHNGARQVTANPFNIPPGGPGTEAISPAATGLGDRWVLQWTEGTTGQHDVRVQTLDDKLVPVGDPVTVSPKGANAGQGVVWVQGDKGVSLFIVASGASHELWGAALRCP